jgi:hypothetical protein
MMRWFLRDPAPTIARSIPREPGHTPFYIRRPNESLQDFIVRIKASGQLPELVEDPHGGEPPRGDDAILDAFTDDTWSSVQDIVESTGKTYDVVRRAVYRAHQRGLLERQHRRYRLATATAPLFLSIRRDLEGRS